MTILLRAKATSLSSRLKSLTPLQRFHTERFNHTIAEGGLQAKDHPDTTSDFLARKSHVVDTSNWKKINARNFGIAGPMIPSATWMVLKILRNEGHKAYLVGGCVRDLILNRVPKDFDVITTARLKQVKKLFHRCLTVGNRFPICLVSMQGSTIEVSSFYTVAKNSTGTGMLDDEENFLAEPRCCDKEDFKRWRNSMHRDFTINSMFFDPFLFQIYDYANGMADLRALKLRTLIPAQISFQEDCARILRGLRIAGRLGLSISKDTETAIFKSSSSLASLSKFRIMMELNYMFAYGAAESTLCLLQRFKLLEMFLPFHAAYLDEQAGENSGQKSIMLMKLFSNLDMMVGSDRPCDCSLWIGLLAFHQTLVINPQDALVLWVFASVLYHGTWKEGVKIARENATVLERFAAEISGFTECRSDKELAVEVAQLASLVQDSLGAFVDSSCLYESMSRYPASQCSGLVFVSKKAGDAVAKLFDVLVNDVASYENRREDSFINYLLLGKGDLDETRFVLGKVILQTLSGGLVGVENEESFNKNCDSILSELSTDVIIVQRSKKGFPAALGPEVKITKKRKLVGISGQMSQVAEGDQQGMQMSALEKKDLCSPQQEMSDKQCASIGSENYLDGVSVHMKSRMTEKQEIVQARSEKKRNIKAASMLRMKELLRSHGRYDESCGTLDGEQNECRAKKFTTKLKLKRHMLHGKETKQQLDVSNSKTLTPNEENDSSPSLEEDVKEKTGKIKQILTKERTGPPSLSSLFK